MIAAAIDIGTNSIKLIVGETAAGNTPATLLDVCIITRLGEGLDESGVLVVSLLHESAHPAVSGKGVAGTANVES